MNLRLFNSLTQKKEEFSTIEKNKVSLYVCGITPYDTTHLGHAFTYLSFDVLVRYLKFLGYEVSYTQNVTDINDRDNDILKRAKEQNIPWSKLAEFWTKKFLTDMDELNWVFPTNYLKASEQIPQITQIIQRIIKNGFGYESKGFVFLDTKKLNDFGKLSRLSENEMLKIAKDFEEDLKNPLKKNPLDITLWRAREVNQPQHIPSFDSPWGQGRPGWHIECSAMSISSLGEQIDIHGGGKDLKYPHHESEIAQSESATGKIPFARFWLHTGTVHINGQKMSKSLGNLVLVSDLLKKYSANAVRFVLLSHHYRDDWTYDEYDFEKAEAYIELFKRCLKNGQKEGEISEEFKKSLDDDLNVPYALQYLIDSCKENKTVGLGKTLDILGFRI